MDQTRTTKRSFESKSRGRRNVERSILQWLEDVENDLREMKVGR
jgi:hypothetical protein